ncbi:MAG: choice-of-anchor I family protein, partial [Cytophagales bacterium]
VILTRSAATPDITVDVTAASTGNAVLGADFNFTTQTLTFPAGSANNTQSFQVAVINNTSSQPTRYAVFQLTNAVGATINSSANSNTHILYIKDDDQTPTTASKAIEFQYTSSYQVGTAGSASAEIVAHDPGTQRLFVVNSIQNRLEILNFSNPAAITAVSSIDMSTYGAGVNSVAVKNGVVAVAVEGTTVATATTAVPGKVVFLDTNGALISQVNVGVQPDMVGFSPDGKTVMTADEGEPNANYSFDPQGSISIIDLSNGAAGLQQSSVSVLNFNAYDAQIASLRSQGIRIYGPNATVSQDFEPEYVTFSNDSRKAWVVLQENNAMVAIDVVNKQITSIFPLGLKDHSISANSFDASDRVSNNQVIPVNWPVKGMLQPDGIAYFEIAGTPYIIGANEGDSRAWTGGSGFPGPGFNEEIRVADAAYVLNPSVFPNAAVLKRNSALGRLQVSNANRNTSTNQYDEIQVLGGRSFAIWNANTGSLVFDSGNAIEKIVSEDATWGAVFNADHSNNNIKDRSDNKGPEPEGVVTTVIAGKTYAFIGLERIGGVMVFDVTNPAAPIFSDYLNSRTVPPTALGGDRGAEGIIYIAAQDSPNGNALILAGNEVSSTVSVYSLKNVAVTAAPVATAATQVLAAGFTANWSSVTGATSYVVEYSTNGFTTFTTQNSTTTSVTITGLSSNTAYSYRVRAVNAFGNSQASNVINTATVLPAPVASAATLLSTNSFTANWATVTGAANYLLDVSSDNFATFVTGFNG